MKVETVFFTQIDASLARGIAELLCTVWPKPGRTVETRLELMAAERDSFTGPQEQAPRSFVIRDNDRVVAHAAILPRMIGTSRGEITVAGLARVCSDPTMRGLGLGAQIARAAFGPVDDGAFPAMLFQTSPKVRPFYEQLGGRSIENRIVNSLGDDPQANPFWDGVAMIYPSGADWPAGEIDLLGPGY